MNFEEYAQQLALTPKQKELARIRRECLLRNETFLKEREDLSRLKKKDFKQYSKRKREILLKWQILEEGWPRQTSPQVRAYSSSYGCLTIEVDLRHSKNKLLGEIKAVLDKWKDSFESDYEELNRERYFTDYQNDKLQTETSFEEYFAKRQTKDANLKKEDRYQAQESWYYEICLRAWDLRKKGYSWGAIKKAMRLHSSQTARNYVNVAQKIISEGVPGFPLFPRPC